MSPLSDTLLDSLAAEAVREGLADALYTRVPTPIGDLLVVSGEHGIVRVGFHEDAEDVILADVAGGIGPRILRANRELADVREKIQAFLEEDGTDLDLPYDLRLVRSPFRRHVLEVLASEVHRGETIRYGELAARSGNPKAARAAGTACATNPVPIVVPCHRVVPSTGGVGNYGGGPPRKVQLLAIEGARY
ncbi:MAG: methylated-DNA-[protein]-cysteine S-methyltransferase [Solirubrobacteraceae bacterium]|jgi:methylated-DNA-[protein]-cysteine S-methyltransferase|nr:methylated-DNA-[protein]-cysteine S-methyltransferase [Solirubrobacteraceae bacterium]